ncbi:MAG: 4-hydroxybenzoate 3-monooxygenase [Xanthobacteraceae bacterium]|nr:MAG: 4-hydroxybenzoate 3-monooxygenase [Xanthobacteraceae bacterium]
MRTQVGIIGAGPAGLMLAHLLRLEGIRSIIIEDRSRAYCEGRRRAGVMEYWVAQMLIKTGVGDRLMREAKLHDGIYFAWDGKAHHIDFKQLIGQQIYVYDQKEVVTDLIAHRLAQGEDILFDVSDVSVHDFESAAPKIRFHHKGEDCEIACDIIAGCDGFHGISRPSFPAQVINQHDKVYPYAWLGILAESPPPEKELIYTWHERGFALFSMRGHDLSRFYLQCTPDEDVSKWPDERIWDELAIRLAGARPLTPGRILQKGITPMRSFVTEPMQTGRLFLAGDAAHIVPPTGAKGMNLAMADVRVLAEALTEHYKLGEEIRLHNYTTTCLRRIWKAQRFSWWMTSLLHIDPRRDTFDMRRQRAELDYVTGSKAAMTSLSENYCGLPFD